MTEDRIAALDGDWSEFTEAERAAFRFAKRLTHEPYALTDDDIARLREHYTDLQILEITFSVAVNNQTTRWKESIGVPQERDASRFLTILNSLATKPVPQDRPLPLKSFLTPTSEKFQDRRSVLAPTLAIGADDDRAPDRSARRLQLESREDTEKALAACRTRMPRLPLVDDDRARALLADDGKSQADGKTQPPLPQWVRLLANFPRDGKHRILSLQALEERGDLKPLLKAQVAWIAAREDRAWYALGLAKSQLKACGYTDDQIYRLDGPWTDFEPGEQAAFAYARKLTGSTELLTDDDIAQMRRHHGDRDTVQLVSYLTNKAFFHRVTEAAGLRLE